MNHPASNLKPFEPVARPMFGITRPFEGLFGFGQTAFLPTQLLYWADDHLLIVRRLNISETYRRIDFADIQGLRVYQNRLYLLFSLIALVLALVALALAFVYYIPGFGGMPNPASGLFLGMGLVALLAALINLGYGPTCTCSLLTAVEVIELPGVARFRHAQRFADELSSRVSLAQGPLPILTDGALPAFIAYQKPLPQSETVLLPTDLAWHKGQLAAHAAGWAVSIFLLDYSIQEADAYPWPVLILSGALLTAFVLCGSMALARQRDMVIGRGLALWTKISLVLTCAVLYLMTITFSFRGMDPTESPGTVLPLPLAIADIALGSILLVVGIMVMLEELRRSGRQPAAA